MMQWAGTFKRGPVEIFQPLDKEDTKLKMYIDNLAIYFYIGMIAVADDG